MNILLYFRKLLLALSYVYQFFLQKKQAYSGIMICKKELKFKKTLIF